MPHLLMRRPNLDDLPPLPPIPLLRTGCAEDAPALAFLLQKAFADSTWTEARVRQDLLDAADVRTTFVLAQGGGTRIATASARLLPAQYPKAGYVHWVAADPTLAGRRLGALVTLAVLHEFVRLGCQEAVLETQDWRLPAIKTYLNLGFVPVDRDGTQAPRWEAIHAQLAPSDRNG